MLRFTLLAVVMCVVTSGVDAKDVKRKDKGGGKGVGPGGKKPGMSCDDECREVRRTFKECRLEAQKDKKHAKTKMIECKKQAKTQASANRKNKHKEVTVACAAAMQSFESCSEDGQSDQATCKKKFVAAFAKSLNISAVHKHEFMKCRKHTAVNKFNKQRDSCVKAASTNEDKKKCFTGKKRKMAWATGKKTTSIKDGDVETFLTGGACMGAMETFKTCSGNSSGTGKQMDCLKKAIGDARNQPASRVSRRVAGACLRRGQAEAVRSAMELCCEVEGTSGESCADDVRDALKPFIFNDKELDDKTMRRYIGYANKLTAKEAVEFCSEESDEQKACVEEVETCDAVDALQQSKQLQTGALESAKEAVNSCKEVREADATATCEDVVAILSDLLGKDKRTALKARRLLFASIMKDSEAECREDGEDEVTFKQCQAEAREATMKILYPGKINKKIRQRKAKRASRDVELQRCGEALKSCMQKAIKAIKGKLSRKDRRDVLNTCKAQARKAQAPCKVFKYLSKSLDTSSCESKDRAACQKAARKALYEGGFAPGLVLHAQKRNWIRQSVDAMVECAEEDNEPLKKLEGCVAAGKEAFQQVSGAGDKTWNNVKNRVIALATASLNGEETVMMPLRSVSVHVITSDAKCDETAKNIKQLINDPCPAVEEKQGCQIADNQLQLDLTCPMEGAEDNTIHDAVDQINDLLNGDRRLNLRRLNVAIEEGGAAQTTVECTASDPICAGSSEQAPSPSPQITTSRSCRSALLSFSLVLMFVPFLK